MEKEAEKNPFSVFKRKYCQSNKFFGPSNCESNDITKFCKVVQSYNHECLEIFIIIQIFKLMHKKGAGITCLSRGIECPLLHEILHTVSKT